jgi:hypothetical protein
VGGTAVCKECLGVIQHQAAHGKVKPLPAAPARLPDGEAARRLGLAQRRAAYRAQRELSREMIELTGLELSLTPDEDGARLHAQGGGQAALSAYIRAALRAF